MNDRIEKLGEQADLLGDFTPTKIPGRYVGYITEEQILKFAELIIRECAEVAIEHTGFWGKDVAQEIKEHFGVK
jgi:hypothetical protein